MNLLTLIATARAVAGLIPVAIDLAKAVQAALPESQGKDKMAVVSTALQGIYATEKSLEVAFEQVWPPLQAALDSIIAIFKSAGDHGFTPSRPHQPGA